MGNNVATTKTQLIIEPNINLQDLFKQILSIDCQVLDIDNINFITQSKLTGSIAKGFDLNDRGFIVWKANCLSINGNTVTEFSTFTTLFNINKEDSKFYYTCSNNGQKLFSTKGGCSKMQMAFLLKLLTNRKLILNKEQIVNYKIIFSDWLVSLADDVSLQITIN